MERLLKTWQAKIPEKYQPTSFNLKKQIRDLSGSPNTMLVTRKTRNSKASTKETSK